MDETQARDLSVWSAFPLLLGGGTSGHAFWLQIEPIDVTHHRVTWHLLAHPDRMLDAAATDTLMAEITVVHVEDMKSCRDVQAGLASGRIPAFRLTPLEAPVADFQRWVAGRLAANGLTAPYTAGRADVTVLWHLLGGGTMVGSVRKSVLRAWTRRGAGRGARARADARVTSRSPRR